MFEDFLNDARFAIRWLRRSPGFTAVAIASFAIGIGFNTTVFTVVDALLFRPLPVREPGRLVDVFTNSDHDRYATTSYPDFVDLRSKNAVFEDMIGYSPMLAALNAGDRARLVTGEVVTGNYFQMLGVKAAIGRTLDLSDDRAGAPPALMVSDSFWRRELGADPRVVGRQIRLRGLPYTVVGVAPRSFTGMFPILSPQLWVPTSQVEEVNVSGIQHNVPSPTGKTLLEKRGSRWMFVKGRLKPGRTVEQASANLAALMRALKAEYAQTNRNMDTSVLRTADVHVHPDANQVLVTVGGALLLLVGLVMLVGCANVASMLLARAAARQREIGIRLAIGASRGRLVRQMLTESLVLAVLGGAAGVALAWLLLRAIPSVHLPIPIPIVVSIPMDGRVLTFTMVVTVLAALVAGLMPAVRASHANIVGDVRGERAARRRRFRRSSTRLGAGPSTWLGAGPSTWLGAGRWTLRDALVAGQIAVTTGLLVCGGLLAQSLLASRNAKLGFRTDGLAVLSMDLQMARYDAARSRQLFIRAVERARAIPGVDHASLGSTLPFGVGFNTQTFFIPGHDQRGGPGTQLRQTDIGAEYFRLLDVPLLEGRAFTDADTPETPRVAIVNQAMARRYWPGDRAVGKVMRRLTADGEPFQIVGVCADYKVHGVGEAPAPYVHLAYNQRKTTYASLTVHTRGDAESLLAQLRRELTTLEPNVVFIDNQTMTRQVAATLFPVQAGAWVVAVMALVTVVLAGIGLYGVIAYSVARRSREIGIRMALGAKPAAILGLVARQGLLVCVTGLVAGALCAIAAARFLAHALYGISAVDPAPWAVAFAVVSLVSTLAHLVPARRAVAVDPTRALRTE